MENTFGKPRRWYSNKLELKHFHNSFTSFDKSLLSIRISRMSSSHPVTRPRSHENVRVRLKFGGGENQIKSQTGQDTTLVYPTRVLLQGSRPCSQSIPFLYLETQLCSLLAKENLLKARTNSCVLWRTYRYVKNHATIPLNKIRKDML